MVFIDLPRTIYNLETETETIEFCGPSIDGRTEFLKLMEDLIKAFSSAGDEAPAKLIYLTNQKIQDMCHRAIELNGIDPAIATWPLVHALLLSEDALLVAINRPKG